MLYQQQNSTTAEISAAAIFLILLLLLLVCFCYYDEIFIRSRLEPYSYIVRYIRRYDLSKTRSTMNVPFSRRFSVLFSFFFLFRLHFFSLQESFLHHHHIFSFFSWSIQLQILMKMLIKTRHPDSLKSYINTKKNERLK